MHRLGMQSLVLGTRRGARPKLRLAGLMVREDAAISDSVETIYGAVNNFLLGEGGKGQSPSTSIMLFLSLGFSSVLVT